MGYSIFDHTMVDLSWPEVERKCKEGAIALLPTGVIEAHGPHMCLGVDTYGSYLYCKLVKEHLESEGVSVIICPPYYWGINHITSAFPGSFTVRKSTMVALLTDILSNLNTWGINRVFNINHHGDPKHCEALFEALKLGRQDLNLKTYTLLSPFDAKRFALSEDQDFVLNYSTDSLPAIHRDYIDIHAGEGETRMMHTYFPNQVDANLAKTLTSTDIVFDDLLKWREGGETAKKVTPDCYLGDPSRYDEEKSSTHLVAKAMAERILLSLKE